MAALKTSVIDSALIMTIPPIADSVPVFRIWSLRGLPSRSYIVDATPLSMATEMRPLSATSSLTASPEASTILPAGAEMIPRFSIAPAIKIPNPPFVMFISPSLSIIMSSFSMRRFSKRYCALMKFELVISRVDNTRFAALIFASGPT